MREKLYNGEGAPGKQTGHSMSSYNSKGCGKQRQGRYNRGSTGDGDGRVINRWIEGDVSYNVRGSDSPARAICNSVSI